MTVFQVSFIIRFQSRAKLTGMLSRLIVSRLAVKLLEELDELEEEEEDEPVAFFCDSMTAIGMTMASNSNIPAIVPIQMRFFLDHESQNFQNGRRSVLS